MICTQMSVSGTYVLQERLLNSLSGKHVHCNCFAVRDVSFDATWYRREHYSFLGFAAAIEVFSGKVLAYVLYDCLRWTEER